MHMCIYADIHIYIWLCITYESSWHNSNNDFFFVVNPELIFLLFLAVFVLHRCFSSLAVLGSAMSALIYCDPLPKTCVKIDWFMLMNCLELHGDLELLQPRGWGTMLCDKDRQIYDTTCSIFVFLKLHLWWTLVPWSSCPVSPRIWNAMTWSNCFGSVWCHGCCLDTEAGGALWLLRVS